MANMVETKRGIYTGVFSPYIDSREAASPTGIEGYRSGDVGNHTKEASTMTTKQSTTTRISFDEVSAVRLLRRMIDVAHSCERMSDLELDSLSESMRMIAETHPRFWRRYCWLQAFWDRLEEEIAQRSPADHNPSPIEGQLSFDDHPDHASHGQADELTNPMARIGGGEF